ncbi:MAG: hypothetical protein MR051_00015 [Lentisphaeria bacterium]|nr:hypothetical protein [Lentisphaeria bacterium]
MKRRLFDLFSAKPELLDRELILDHLPEIFRAEFPDRTSRIPAPYLKAVAAAEAAGRMVFSPDDPAVSRLTAELAGA